MKSILIFFLGLLPLTLAIKISFDNVNFIGRTVRTQADTIQSDWPNTGVTFQFRAEQQQTNLQISFSDCNNNCHSFVSVEMNCNQMGKHEVSSSTMINTTLPTEIGKTYEISVRKITETLCGDAYGTLEITGISLSQGRFLSRNEFHDICGLKKKLLVFGDSYTAAYGVDELDPCIFTAETEDVTHGYAFLTSVDVSADIHIVAWSGKGVVRNYGDVNPVSVDPLPSYYNRTLGAIPAVDPSTNYWSPASYSPDLVVVMLGTNDYSTEPRPSDEQFVSGLSSFLRTIQSDYQTNNILVLCAPASPSIQCQNIASAATATGTAFLHIEDSVFSGGKGCSGHPYKDTQRNMADFILPTVRTMLN
jgi:hypothetical protein